MHYTDKREAKAVVGQYLRANGWTLYGWHADTSDMMTDYYAPAHWDGIATKQGYTLCVDIQDWAVRSKSGYVPETRDWHAERDCSHCQGSGIDPSGWTLNAARQDPIRYNREMSPRGTMSLMPTVVSPIPFRSDGNLRCTHPGCHDGKLGDIQVTQQPDKQWPTFQANPAKRSWHVEKNGVIVGSGTGIFAIADANDHLPENNAAQLGKLAALLQKIEGTMQTRVIAVQATPARVPMTDQGSKPRISKGSKPGYIELRFASKPAADVLTRLKAAKFRWAHTNKCWYGLASNIGMNATLFA